MRNSSACTYHTLVDDVVPFWLNHALDREYGGYLICLDRDGSLLTPIKSGVWKGPFHLPRALLYGYKLLAANDQ